MIPWMELNTLDLEFWDAAQAVLDKWNANGLEDSISTTDNPDFFSKYFEYLDMINAIDAPDYDHLREMFMSLLTQEDIERDDLGFLDIIEVEDNYNAMGEEFVGRTELMIELEEGEDEQFVGEVGREVIDEFDEEMAGEEDSNLTERGIEEWVENFSEEVDVEREDVLDEVGDEDYGYF